MSGHIGDQMHQTVFTNAFTVDQRLERISQLSDEAAAVCADHLEDPETRLEALHCADWLACEPALVSIAKREPFAPEVTAEVYGNLARLFKTILEYEGANFTRHGAKQNEVEGRLAEMSVLGLLSRRAAHSDLEKSYILPATRRQDYGSVENRNGNSYRTGADLIIYNGMYNEQPVQVKKSKAGGDGRSPYKPGIPILRPYRLIREPRKYATLLLMDAIVRDDDYELHKAQARAQANIEQTKGKARKYHREQFKLPLA